MKTLITIFLSSIFISLSIASFSQGASEKIIEGIYQEEVKGDLDKATEIFKEVLNDYSDDKQECARALYHLGLITEKKSGSEDVGKGLVPVLPTAESYYAQLIEKYPEYGAYADLARNRLDKLHNANTFIDPRDGHKYKWVRIGNQIWMAENLAFMPHVNPPKKQEYGIWVYDYDGDDVAEAKATENYQKYGCLYDWPTAMGLEPEYLEKEWGGDTEYHQGICPPGWHLPSDKDWQQLEISQGMPIEEAKLEGYNRAGTFEYNDTLFTYPPVGRFFKSKSGWNSDGEGDNSSGFNALPSGARYPPGEANMNLFDQIGEYTSFWNSDESFVISRSQDTTYYTAWNRYLWVKKTDDVAKANWDKRSYGASLRCIKDNINGLPLNNIKVNHKKDFAAKIESNNINYESPQIIWETEVSSKYPRLVNSSLGIICNSDSLMITINPLDGSIIHQNSIEGITNNQFRVIGKKIIYIAKGQIICREIDTWKKIWAFTAEEGIGTITADEYHVLFQSGRFSSKGNGTRALYCLNIDNGSVIWKKSASYSFGRHAIISDGKVFLGTFNLMDRNDENFILAYNLSDGAEVWRFPVGNAILSTPAINNSSLFICTQDNYVYALNIDSGKKLWGYYVDCRMTADPLFDNGKVFFGDLGEQFNDFPKGSSYYALDANTGKVLWVNRELTTGHSRFYEGSVRFGKLIVSGTQFGEIYAFNPQTGEIEWYFESQGRNARFVVIDDLLIVRANDKVYGLKSPGF